MQISNYSNSTPLRGNVLILRSVNAFSQSVLAKPFIVHQYTRRQFLSCCLQFIIFYPFHYSTLCNLRHGKVVLQTTNNNRPSLLYAVGGDVMRSTGGSLQQVDP